MRNKYNQNKNLDINQVEQMNDKLNNFLAVVENYPVLKTNSQYTNFQNQLSKIENELQNARHRYNDVVTRYNIAIETVPSNIVASIFTLKKIISSRRT